MQDRFGRHINYLRLSVTDRCNLKCVYCKGAGAYLRSDDLLTRDEIVAVVRAAVAEGIDRVRLTGGEPLMRQDIVSVVSALREIRGIREISMTTNGLLLGRYAGELKAAGLSRVNISLDTLSTERFRSITGGHLEEVLNGVEQAEANFNSVKLNVVVMRRVNLDEVEAFAAMTMNRPIEVRFIEHMALGGKRLSDSEQFVPAAEVLEILSRLGNLMPIGHDTRSGPAQRFRYKNARGTIGLITPVSAPFCGHCNRLRLTAEGKLRSCLLQGGEVDVRTILRNETPNRDSLFMALRQAFHRAADLKPLQHEGCGTVCMSRVGG